MGNPRMPVGLGAGGKALWRAIVAEHTLSAVQIVQLTEACRQKDRLDEMDRIIQGKGVLNLMRFRVDDIFTIDDERKVSVTVKFDGIIDRANSTANTMKQLIAALRLPDESGAVPQRRGPRGAQKPSQAGGAEKPGKVSSFERAQQRAAERAASAGG